MGENMSRQFREQAWQRVYILDRFYEHSQPHNDRHPAVEMSCTMAISMAYGYKESKMLTVGLSAGAWPGSLVTLPDMGMGHNKPLRG